jgi:hypothetical protein
MALELGPCGVFYGVTDSEVDMGKTMGGVTVRIVDDSIDLKSDQYGSGAENTVITGTTVEVELSLAEVTLANIAVALGQTNVGVSPGVVPGLNKTGNMLLSTAGSLILKKYALGSSTSDEEDWIHFPAAGMVSNVEMAYDSENQRVMRITFKCFPATVNAAWGTAADHDKIVTYWFGDNTIADS